MKRIFLFILMQSTFSFAANTIEVEIRNNSLTPVLISTNHVESGTPYYALVYTKIPTKYTLLADGKNNFFYLGTAKGIHSLSRIGDNDRYGKDRWQLSVDYNYAQATSKDQFKVIASIPVEDLQRFSNKISITIEEGEKLPSMRL